MKLLASTVFALIGFTGTALSQLTPVTTAELNLKDGKTVFRSGEPVTLEMTFRTNGDGCYFLADMVPSLMDSVEVTPSQGAIRWVQGNGRGSDAFTASKLDTNKPVIMSIVLNDLYRFDQPGTYSVKVNTKHVRCGAFNSPATELQTSTVTFSLEQVDQADEKALAESLEQRIRTARGQGTVDTLARELNYLPGDDATRIKLSVYLHPENYSRRVNVEDGLWISRNRAMVESALKQAVGDPTSKAGGSQALLETLVALERNSSMPQPAGFLPWRPKPDDLMSGYLHTLASSLPKRLGESRLEAAMTVFECEAAGYSPAPWDDHDFQAARAVVILHFAEISPYSVDYVIRTFGDFLIDTRLVPALQNLVDHSDGIFSGTREVASKHLQKIAGASPAK